jgi:hypothetical protein
MKKIKFFVAAAMCVVTLCANAQNTVIKEVNLDDNGKTELRNFFSQHPTDTIRTSLNGKAVKLYVQNGNVCYDEVTPVATATPKASALATTSTPTAKTTAKVEKVEKTANDGRKVTLSNGDTMSLKRTAVSDISTEEGIEILNGKRIAVNPEHKDYSGLSLHRLQFAILGGANYFGCFAPQVTFRVGYETCHWVFQVDGVVSRSELGETSQYPGAHYSNLSITGGVGYKLWQSLKLDNYLAVVAQVGYGFNRTDQADAEITSGNYGFTAGVGIQGVISLSAKFALAMEAGWKMYPDVDKGAHEVQKFSNQGAYAQVGVIFRLS